MILINGASGGIGSDLDEYLTELGRVHALSRVDICDGKAVDDEVGTVSPTVIVHLAAVVGTKDCEEMPGQAIETNVRGTYNVARAATRYGARLIYFSSSAIYRPGIIPISEGSPIDPQTIYGMTKWWGEQVARRYVAARDLVVVRPVMGFGGKGDRVSQLVALIRSHWTRRRINLLLDPSKRKDPMPVRNISTAVRTLVDGARGGGIYNVAYGDPEPYGETIRRLRHHGLDPCYTMHPEGDYVGDHVVTCEPLRALGWDVSVSREDELHRVILDCQAEFEI